MAPSWGPHLESGVQDIDAQHREIVEATSALEAALGGRDDGAVERTLECLTSYVLVHFETEERWMRAQGHPGLRDHVAKHDEFVTRLVAMRKDHADGDTSSVLKLRVRNALGWLEDHIGEEDLRLTEPPPAPRARAARREA